MCIPKNLLNERFIGLLLVKLRELPEPPVPKFRIDDGSRSSKEDPQNETLVSTCSNGCAKLAAKNNSSAEVRRPCKVYKSFRKEELLVTGASLSRMQMMRFLMKKQLQLPKHNTLVH